MTFKEYCKEFKATLNNELDVKDSIIDYTLGLAGESGELYNVCVNIKLDEDIITKGDRIADEAGDLVWYVSALYYSIFNRDIADVMSISNVDSLSKLAPNIIRRFDHEKTLKSVMCEIMQLSASIAENVKHYIYHNRDLDMSAVKDALIEIMYLVGNLVLVVNTNKHYFRISIEEILDYNIFKLKIRHPNGFVKS